MTTQNLVNLSLTETQISNVDAALTTLETELAGLIALSAVEKRRTNAATTPKLRSATTS